MERRPIARIREALRRYFVAGILSFAPLAITIWHLNDGRYSTLEDAYANALKAQLEETSIFQVSQFLL